MTIIFGAVALASAIDWAIDRADRRRQSESWRNYRAWPIYLPRSGKGFILPGGK
jgi:hypothetical protein